MRIGRTLIAVAVVFLLPRGGEGACKADEGGAITLLARSDGATDHLQLAAALDTLRAMRGDAAPAAETLSALLPHQAKLYADRDKNLVIRLRAYIMVTLGEIGYPDSALPALYDTLAHIDERMTAIEVGAAARAAGSLGPRGRDLAPYLLDTLIDRFSGDEFSLERYGSDFPPAEATTVHLEAVRSLGRICSAEDHEVLAALRRLLDSRIPDARVAREARRAVELITARGERP
jgi:hypothetical protein